MNRRAFLGAFAVVLAAHIAAMATKFEPVPQMLNVSSEWLGECYETPNGETITSIKVIGSGLFVFTESCVYEVPL